uniref:Solute carrier family 10 member 1 n=1 Tax=Salarias fasciatus TaxID=181472 RepID=A0A672FAF3_SALFA
SMQTHGDRSHIMDYTTGPLLYPSLGQNVSFLFNLTANSSSGYAGLSPQTSSTIGTILIVALTINMVSMGCTMEATKIMKNILKPKGVATAILSQYGVMPLTAFVLSKAFQLQGMMTVAVLVCGCSPGGAFSNILALALKGDMNLSIVMTSCSTLLALGMMPLLLYIYCQGFANVHKLVPYTQIVISLALILVPCGVGIVINHYRPKYANIFLKVRASGESVATVIVMLVVEMGEAFMTVLAPSLMAISFIMPLIGYSFGFVISSLFKLSHSQRRTVAMETGCQNIQLCSTILKVAFPPEETGPLFMFPMIFGIFQLSEAAALIVLFRCYERFTSKEKGNGDGRIPGVHAR